MSTLADLGRLALAVRRLERTKTAMRWRSCELEEPSDAYSVGNPPCWRRLMDNDNWPEDEFPPCEPCVGRLAEFTHVRPLLNAAKRRLRRALDRRLQQ